MTWAIGDVQGCYKSLRALLEKISFDQKRDKLWFVGDLVNRGEGSLEVLEFLYEIRDSIVTVLGNHDISLLAAYWGIKRSNPSIEPILNSKDAPRLIEWIQHRPFLHLDYSLNSALVHAGISPEFDLGMAIWHANELAKNLQSKNAKGWLKQMLDGDVKSLNSATSSLDTQRYALGSFTRMRYCYEDGRLDFKQKGAPTQEVYNRGLKPWFSCKSRKEIELKIIFGHWSTLGLYESKKVLGIDTGCIWGGELTAAGVDDFQIVQVECDKRS